MGLGAKINNTINRKVKRKTIKKTISLEGEGRKKKMRFIRIRMQTTKELLRMTRGSLSLKPDTKKRIKNKKIIIKEISPSMIQKFISPKVNNAYLFVNL